MNKSRINISVVDESGVSGPEAVRTTNIPMIPKRIDDPIKTRVAIFCMILVYHITYAQNANRFKECHHASAESAGYMG